MEDMVATVINMMNDLLSYVFALVKEPALQEWSQEFIDGMASDTKNQISQQLGN